MSRKKIVVTGAGSGIGKATAQRFAAEGYDVLLNDINKVKLDEVLSTLPAGDHLVLDGSYSTASTIAAAEKLISEEWNRVDVLVNCAGIFEKTDPLSLDVDSWRRTFDIMVNGSVLMSRLALKYMPDHSRIIHITSIHGTRAEAKASSYSMAKAAIDQLCRTLAIELAPRNILVNAIAPGFVDTPMAVVDGINELETEWFRRNYMDGHHLPLKRAATPQEIAGVAFFLAGKDASYITGQVLIVDGGLTITF